MPKKYDLATTLTGAIAAIGAVIATLQHAKDISDYGIGAAIATAVALQGYLTHKD